MKMKICRVVMTLQREREGRHEGGDTVEGNVWASIKSRGSEGCF